MLHGSYCQGCALAFALLAAGLATLFATLGQELHCRSLKTARSKSCKEPRVLCATPCGNEGHCERLAREAAKSPIACFSPVLMMLHVDRFASGILLSLGVLLLSRRAGCPFPRRLCPADSAFQAGGNGG